MQDENKKNNKKRIFIATATTISLLILPHTEVPESLMFTVPLIAEGVGFLGLIAWSGYKGKSAKKRKITATTELKTSIEQDIDKCQQDIEKTNDPLIKDTLRKQLMDLYEERRQENKITRDKIRADITKSEEEEKSYAAEAIDYKKELANKASEEIEKINEQNQDDIT